MNIKFIISIIVISTSLIYSQCDNLNESLCGASLNCEWVQNFNNYSCSGFNQNQCYQYQGCDWTLSYGGSYGEWSHSCSGSYQIDNSYCEEVEMPECYEMNQNSCDDTNTCQWVEDIESGSCSSLYSNDCNSMPGCSWNYDCVQWGSWYTWLCYEYGYECNGGTYYVDNGYCEETVEYLMGDINGDYLINILDVIETVNLIINGEYDSMVDMDNNYEVNVLDIIQIINIILNQR